MLYKDLAIEITDQLGLAHPPVGVAIVDKLPSGIKALSKPMISACSLWREAEQGTFFAAGAAHFGCAVGAHVMGFALDEGTQLQLMGAVGLMSQVGYLDKSEVPNIPRIAKAGAGAVYGPLAEFPLEALCAVVWVTPAQAMFLGEALQTTAWMEGRGPAGAFFGRPACSALARTANTQQESLSLGCAGMRMFTDIAPSLALFVIPGNALLTLVDKLDQTAGCTGAMLSHYTSKKDAFTAAT